jgi:hypothetical protein
MWSRLRSTWLEWRERARQNREMVSAVRRGDVAAVEKLLDAGVSPNLVTDRVSVLGLAVAKDHGEIVTLLLKRGARIDAPGNEHFLLCAVRGNNYEMVALGVARGLDVNRRPRWGITPLERAVALGDIAMIDQLLDLGADPAKLRFVRWFCESSTVIRHLAAHGAHVPEDVWKAVEEGHWDPLPRGDVKDDGASD